jgi:Hairy Orange
VAKLEKADILELTVKHLHTLRQQNKLHVRPDINFTERFRAGFSHCATEVAKFLNNVDQSAGVRVVQHLNDCVRQLDTTTVTYPMNPPPVAPVRPLIPAKYTNYYPGQPGPQPADPEFFRQQHPQLQHHAAFVNVHPQQAAAAAAAYMARFEDLKIKQQLDSSADQSVWRPWG